jgi:signal transduction histidine kinase
MRLVAKLTVALVLCMSVVLAFFGWRSVQRERTLLGAYRHHAGRALLGALVPAVREAYRREGEAGARRLVAEADTKDDLLKLRWVWLDAPAGDPARPEAPAGAWAPGEVVQVQQGAPRELVYAKVDVGGRPAAIELSESLEEEARILRTGAEHAALTVAALALSGGVMALALGLLFVGRPVQRIVDKTRRIGAGDLAGPLELRGSDELARVAEEIDLMCGRLQQARVEIDRETAARIAALEQLRHADRLGTVGKLASGIAHELGTPLNVVGGRAKRILRGAPPAEVEDNARIIVEQADRMTRIIRQLLDFARRRGANKAPADIGAIAREVLVLLGPHADKRRVKARLEGDDDAPRVEVDAGQIQQALTNLVMNAIQAMPEGGDLAVRISREQTAPPPGHRSAEGEHVAIRVSDQGVGIRADQLPHVFEPFFTTKDVGEGTGLGLSVTWGIIEEHDGWITVESEPGRGTTFTAWLPVDPSATRGARSARVD